MENLTREYKLIDEITSKGWFANPAGRQGYEVIVLQQVGDGGTRYYASLKPGETLRFNERVFGSYRALAVDMRHARSFPVSGQFNARERGRKVSVKTKVFYRVTDARIVAMETDDPLGELRDQIVASLTNELSRISEANITASQVANLIRSIGYQPHLGLQVENAVVVEFTPDSRMTGQEVQVEDVQHTINVEGIKQDATLRAEEKKREVDIRLRQKENEALPLTDLTTLMREHPEQIQLILTLLSSREQKLLDMQFSAVQPAITAYIQQQQQIDGQIDPYEIVRLVREAIVPNDASLPGLKPGKIVWGDTPGLPAPDIQIYDAKKEDLDKKSAQSKPRIEFGE